MGNYLATLFVLPFSASLCYSLLLFLLITFIFYFSSSLSRLFLLRYELLFLSLGGAVGLPGEVGGAGSRTRVPHPFWRYPAGRVIYL